MGETETKTRYHSTTPQEGEELTYHCVTCQEKSEIIRTYAMLCDDYEKEINRLQKLLKNTNWRLKQLEK